MENKALGFLFERTTRIIKLNFHQLFKSNGLDLTPEQWVILDILSQNECLSQKEIADLSFKDAPSTSRILKGLTSRNYIQRLTDGADKRLSSVSLTELGTELVAKLRPQVDKLRSQGIDGISEKDVVQLISIMNQVFENYS